MPLYRIQHTTPLTRKQKEALVAEITAAHPAIMGNTGAFVNVSFTLLDPTDEFVGGRQAASTNRIAGSIRSGRDEAQKIQMVERLGDIWERVVVQDQDTMKEDRQGTKCRWISLEETLKEMTKDGIRVPLAGAQVDWVKRNRAAFACLASEGKLEYEDLSLCCSSYPRIMGLMLRFVKQYKVVIRMNEYKLGPRRSQRMNSQKWWMIQKSLLMLSQRIQLRDDTQRHPQ